MGHPCRIPSTSSCLGSAKELDTHHRLPRIAQRRGVSIDISKLLVYRPENTLLLDYSRKFATNCSCPDQFRCAPRVMRKIMYRLGSEACGNRAGIGVVARLEIRSEKSFHALNKCEMRHSVPLLGHTTRCGLAIA
jgi:hypothetical protein